MRRIVSALLASGLLLSTVSVAAAGTIPAAGSTPAACSWMAKSDPDTVNVAYPDTSASYWSYAYSPVPGTQLVIHGSYPKARYFSFHVYQPSGVPIDSIYDAQIKPDAGSANPFAGPAGKGRGRHYTVTVRFTARPSKPARNTIYAGQTKIDKSPNPGGLLMLRVYVPVDPASPSGGVPLPTVTWETASGQVIDARAACSSDLPDTNGAATKQLDAQSPPAEVPASGSSAPVWKKAASDPYAGAFGNQQNAYLTASLSRLDGDLLVIHAKAPTFPDTSAGQPVYGNYQLRYWSMCENSTDTRVIDCAPDYQTVQRGGYYTYVVSDPSQRPADAIARDGVTWLPWGPTDATALLIFRNMVPAISFRAAVQNVPNAGGDPAKVMGAYYPHAVYCATSTFARGGWRACFAKG